MQAWALVLTLATVVLAGCQGRDPRDVQAEKDQQAFAKLSPEEQLKKLESDTSIPPEMKQMAINAHKQKYGLK
jgi:sulfur transfer protein SufE